jgi:hypothetical protein
LASADVELDEHVTIEPERWSESAGRRRRDAIEPSLPGKPHAGVVTLDQRHAPFPISHESCTSVVAERDPGFLATISISQHLADDSPRLIGVSPHGRRFQVERAEAGRLE